ncbi:hypothetical protein BS17DRAFT_766350 [Gyrodon lividus]|nr:hypothetical protein BS17DRAFT_766350 [Gyrodon lividus]
MSHNPLPHLSNTSFSVVQNWLHHHSFAMETAMSFPMLKSEKIDFAEILVAEAQVKASLEEKVRFPFLESEQWWKNSMMLQEHGCWFCRSQCLCHFPIQADYKFEDSGEVVKAGRESGEGDKEVLFQPSTNCQAAQVLVPVDLDVQMASPPKTLDDNDNSDDNDGSNKANDSKELEWEGWFAQMDQQLSQAHKDHKALVATLSAFEEQGRQTGQVDTWEP